MGTPEDVHPCKCCAMALLGKRPPVSHHRAKELTGHALSFRSRSGHILRCARQVRSARGGGVANHVGGGASRLWTLPLIRRDRHRRRISGITRPSPRSRDRLLDGELSRSSWSGADLNLRVGVSGVGAARLCRSPCPRTARRWSVAKSTGPELSFRGRRAWRGGIEAGTGAMQKEKYSHCIVRHEHHIDGRW
jgi:hypothetical protein